MIPDSERFQSVADGSDLATPAPWPPTDAECLAVLLKARALGFIVKPDVHPRLIRVKPPKDSDSYSHDYVRALFRCSAGIRRLLLKESPPPPPPSRLQIAEQLLGWLAGIGVKVRLEGGRPVASFRGVGPDVDRDLCLSAVRPYRTEITDLFAEEEREVRP